MQKIQIQAEVDVKSLLAQLDTDELEDFMQKAAAVLTQRRTGDKKARETALLQQLNETCVLPEASWAQFRILLDKRAQATLSEAEALQLEKLIQEEEALRVQRIKILGELVQLKGTGLLQIAEELGIQPLEAL